ncbi:Nucleoside diphosphate kinase [Candidatus Clavichlamydia salmonicola]|uniref:nucleoside-diphosphate kinase n=2 Tax=Candidatus Clavichlamydia salmonicola TaxID=469812 RepID=UPI001891A219|nr:Nucleoside diphosphate kinase [Candidatus Clavichlamydia salmonicola]
MTMQQTLSIIKPNVMKADNVGAVIARLESAGLRIKAMKMIQMTQEEAQNFYLEHAARPFYGELVDFMISSPVVVMVLEAEDAVRKNRDIMGATNPKDAAAGTIRADFSASLGENAVHGSDSDISAAREIAFFFSKMEIA